MVWADIRKKVVKFIALKLIKVKIMKLITIII